MVVLDRSCSMNKTIAGTTGTKWEAAVAAVEHATGAYAQRIRWGMTLFPDNVGDKCAQDTIDVPIGDGTASVIESMLTAALDPADVLHPGNVCSTPIDTGIVKAATDPGLADPAHPASIVLVTDGKQSTCALAGGDMGTEAAVDTLRQNGVTTYVVGFGDSVDIQEMDKLAHLGGAPLAGPHAYYQADTPGDLDIAVDTIARSAVSCTFHVEPAPSDLAQTYVWFDKTQQVPRDPAHAAGWDFDAATNQLTLYGASCDTVVTGAATSVDVVFGCPQPPIL
jgi:hypothetical protein